MHLFGNITDGKLKLFFFIFAALDFQRPHKQFAGTAPGQNNSSLIQKGHQFLHPFFADAFGIFGRIITYIITFFGFIFSVHQYIFIGIGENNHIKFFGEICFFEIPGTDYFIGHMIGIKYITRPSGIHIMKISFHQGDARHFNPFG